jgi:hypothetical protein
MEPMLILAALGLLVYWIARWQPAAAAVVESDSGISGVQSGSLPDNVQQVLAMQQNSRPTLQQWAQAITDFESGGNPKALNYRTNNPGNLRNADGSFRTYGTFEAGWNALIADLAAKTRKYADWSLLDIMRRYLGGSRGVDPPADQGNAQAYANYLADRLGVSTDDTLGSIFG